MSFKHDGKWIQSGFVCKYEIDLRLQVNAVALSGFEVPERLLRYNCCYIASREYFIIEREGRGEREGGRGDRMVVLMRRI